MTVDSDDDSDREFEKFLMASISGSDLTSGRADTGRESKKLTKSLDWNVSSSEDIDSKPPSRFIKTATLTELDNILAETTAPKPTHEPTSLEPQGILAALESQMLVGDSWARQPVFKKTGPWTVFLAQNLDKLLDRLFSRHLGQGDRTGFKDGK